MSYKGATALAALLAGLGMAGALLVASGGLLGPGDYASVVTAYPEAGPDLIAAVFEVASQVGTDPVWLAGVIHFETGGKWTADVGNPASGAIGLIQFMPGTAAKLGTSTAKLRNMRPVEQMAWVRLYLDRVRAGRWDDGLAGPLDSAQALAMAVFYPRARYWPSYASFPGEVRAANPGIETPADYLGRVVAFSRLWR